MEEVKIQYADPLLIKSFYDVLADVAQEGIYIEMVTAPDYKKVEEFQKKLIQNNHPVFYAVLSNNKVVGWIDISPSDNPRMAHRGFLGMGIGTKHREQKIGSRLMEAAIKHSRDIGLEKIELTVYTNNIKGIGLYKKFGFKEAGIIKHFRKYNGQYFDGLTMELFL